MQEFISTNRAEIVARCRAEIASRPTPRATDLELEYGVPVILDRLVDSLRQALRRNPAIGVTAAKRGSDLLRSGLTIEQVARDYGGICHVILELALESRASIAPHEFQVLDTCVDEAIARAVTEFAPLHGSDRTGARGHLAHEMRAMLDQAVLSFDALALGSVGAAGKTAGVLAGSLDELRKLIDRVDTGA